VNGVVDILVCIWVEGCVVFVGYLLVGFLDFEILFEVVWVMVWVGVDVVEIGVFYIDLFMDGLVI